MHVFVTGASGYLGRALAEELLSRGHRVRGLVRPGSEDHLPPGCELAVGQALAHGTWAHRVPRGATLVHLVGTPRPSPRKAREFRRVDLASVAEALAAAKQAQARHFVYVSVAHPAPVMRTYVAARREAEELVRASGIPATILRPWYVLGPGHRWPLLLLPAYALASLFPGSRETARRLGLVTRARMVRALADSVEHPAAPLRVLGVPDIRAAGAFPFPSSPNPIGAAHAWIRRATRSLPAAGSTP